MCYFRVLWVLLMCISCSTNDIADKNASKKEEYSNSQADKKTTTEIEDIERELLQTMTHNRVTREYLLYVPSSLDQTKSAPLLFNFHGFGGQAAAHLAVADMRILADTHQFILVYPQGSLLNGYSHWNAGLDTKENKSSADDIGFITALIDEIALQYNIDSESVYACGYSNGGFFSYALACYLSDKIAAVASVSGTMLKETLENCDPSHVMPMINIHGTSDVVVPYTGEEGLSSIDQVLDYWKGFNDLGEPVMSRAIENGATIEHYRYTNDTDTMSVEHYKVINGGHVWFNNRYNDKTINELIWNFVSQYDLKGLKE